MMHAMYPSVPQIQQSPPPLQKSPLLEEAPDKLPVLDLVIQLLTLSTAPDLDTEDADFLEADLDSPSRHLEEVLDTSLDEDDEANLES